MRILGVLNRIPEDKKLHIIVGLTIYAMFNILVGVYAIAPTILVAVGKEIYDMYAPSHTSDIGDVLATIAVPVVLAGVEYAIS